MTTMPRPARLPVWLALAGLAIAAPARTETGRVAWVTDGDTFRLTTGERIRIAGIDAPETHADQARCRRELALGEAAAAVARELLDGQPVALTRVGRSYRRTVARVRIGGRDLATLLVARGAARWWGPRQAKPDWCGGQSW